MRKKKMCMKGEGKKYKIKEKGEKATHGGGGSVLYLLQ